MKRRNDRKDPSIPAFLLFAIIGVTIIMIVFRKLEIPYIFEFAACGALGWYGRRIIWWLLDLRDAVIVKLNEWAQK